VKYDTKHLEAPVAYAIVTGILGKDKIPSELLEHLATWIKFYKEREADGNTLEDDVPEEDGEPSNRRK
jgi:hypothetical protein